MSLGIAIAVNDTVLLIADGRRSTASALITDRAEKIMQVNGALAVIECGDPAGANVAVAQLRGAVTASSSGRDVTNTIVDSVRKTAMSLLASVSPGTADMSRMNVGLVAGGIDAEGVYVGGAMFGHGMAAPATDLARPGPGELQFVVLGGEAVGAKAYFVELASRAMNVSGNDPHGLLIMLQRAAKKTIQYAASRDPSIGGRVQCLILAKGQLARASYL